MEVGFRISIEIGVLVSIEIASPPAGRVTLRRVGWVAWWGVGELIGLVRRWSGRKLERPLLNPFDGAHG